MKNSKFNNAHEMILCINSGSSSIKFSLFDLKDSLRRVLDGEIEGIGLSIGSVSIKKIKSDGSHDSDGVKNSLVIGRHAEALLLVMDVLENKMKSAELIAIGHRVVHGGDKYHQPQIINTAVIKDLQQLSGYAPEHLPKVIALIEALKERLPHLLQIACFDTAFHHDLPAVAKRFAIPRRYFERGIKRYGFHGLSYAYLMQELELLAGEQATKGRIILAHLGSGASMAAVQNGQSIDTSMGFTPAAGLMMGTRCGDIDPGLLAYLMENNQMNSADFNRMINRESGLLGVSEISADMRDLLRCEESDTRAAEAVAMFCYQVKKMIGAYAAALGGLDTLVFSGGMGENSAVIRERICAGLEFLGIEVDASLNQAHAPIISCNNSRITVRVIQTDEALMIARSVHDFMSSEALKLT